jgi:hypothetical protein
MRVSFVANARFVDRYTGTDGVVAWRGDPRPVFALATYGQSTAFVSFLPQAPLPSTIVGVTVDSAAVRAGEIIRVAGFARSRNRSSLRPAVGEASLALRFRGSAVAQTRVRLDAAGAFSGNLPTPAGAAPGDYTILATVDGSTAGANVHVDADSGGLSLKARAQCENRCDPSRDVPVEIDASRAGAAAPNVEVSVDVIRSPHAGAGETAESAPWGVTEWYQTTLRTDENGRAVLSIPHPTDELSSTYGVRVRSGGATADTRVVVTTAPVALRVHVDRDVQNLSPIAFDVYGNDASSGNAAAGLSVRAQLVHGSNVQEQTLTLDARGHAHGTFASPQIGSNLVLASAEIDGARALDAEQVQIDPQARDVASAAGDVQLELDRQRYRPGDSIVASASLDGASGDAALTFESAQGTQVRIVPISGGRATATFKASAAAGDLTIGAAMVRDGSLHWNSVAVALDAPGRPDVEPLHLDRSSYQPGAVALSDQSTQSGTLFVRVSRGSPTGAASFETVPQLMDVGTTTTQDSAGENAAWHPSVDSAGNRAELDTFVRRTAPPQDLALAQAQTQNLYWSVDHHAGASVAVPVPAEKGSYTLSVLKIDDDGRVSAASGQLLVQ